jgi:hypothetical protein
LQILDGLLGGPGNERKSLIHLGSDVPFQAFVCNELGDGIGVRRSGLDECLIALSVASSHLHGTNGCPVGFVAYFACIDSCQQRLPHFASVDREELLRCIVVKRFAICTFVVWNIEKYLEKSEIAILQYNLQWCQVRRVVRPGKTDIRYLIFGLETCLEEPWVVCLNSPY